MLVKILIVLLPWSLKRRALARWFGYRIHPNAYIGLAWVYPRKLNMEADTRIEHFTVAIHLDLIHMDEKSAIGRGNWITGFPSKSKSPHFKHQINRQSILKLGESATITKYHHLDCTNLINIGRFATVAGYHSQFLTHSINIIENRQDSSPIFIGEYTFIGTNVVILGGAVLPSYSILGAKSLLNKNFLNEFMLYGGVPARAVQALPKDARYFTRIDGFVF